MKLFATSTHSTWAPKNNFLLPFLPSQNFGDREQRVVVIYVTTLSILRDTWARCVKVRQILRNLLIKVDERQEALKEESRIDTLYYHNKINKIASPWKSLFWPKSTLWSQNSNFSHFYVYHLLSADAIIQCTEEMSFFSPTNIYLTVFS